MNPYLLTNKYFLEVRTLLLCIACFFSNGTFALDLPIRPCSAWNTARKANLSTVVQREWVYGYLTGMSDALKALSSEDVFALLPPNENTVAYLNSYCENQPESSVNQGAQSLFDQIRKRP